MQQTMVHKAKERTGNSMRLEFDAVSANEGLARMAAAAFVAELDPTLEEISDVKTAVSEAVTNAIIHGYEGEPGKVCMECTLQGDVLNVSVTDYGVGITDLEQAMQPLFTTKPELDARVWDLPLWRPLWMIWRYNPCPAEGQQCG